jgi:hypothetical protein
MTDLPLVVDGRPDLQALVAHPGVTGATTACCMHPRGPKP